MSATITTDDSVAEDTMKKITTVKVLIDHIRNGGGVCYVDSMILTKEKAIAAQKLGDIVCQDSADKSRYAVHTGVDYMTTINLLLDGDFRSVKLTTDDLKLVDFATATADVDKHVFDVDGLRIAENLHGVSYMDSEYGGNWYEWYDLAAQNIAAFTATLRGQNNA